MSNFPPTDFSPAELKPWYRPDRRLLFITGAGISVDSGLPTYRGVAGLYETADTEDGIPIEIALSGNMFARRPETTWKYLMQIADACRGRSFNRGHQLIAELESYFDEVCVLTQNIDGFHKDAGSSRVIEIHGTMRRLRCDACRNIRELIDWEAESIPPACPHCPSEMRPDVVLFGEMLPDQAVQQYQAELNRGLDAIFVVGTSALFPYIASPVHQYAGTDCLTVEINPEVTDLTPLVDIKLPMGATAGLEQFVAGIRSIAAGD